MNKTEKKLFWQNFSLMITITLIVCVAFSFVAAQLLKSFSRKNLEITSERVAESFFVAQAENVVPGQLADELVQFLGNAANAEIIMFDNNGNIKIATQNYEKLMPKETIYSYMEKIISGESISFGTKSDFLYENIAIGKPMVYNGYIIGGIFCAISGEFVSAIMAKIFDYLLIFFAIVLLAFVFISRKIAKRQAMPLNMLKKAIRLVSSGDFEKHLPFELKGDLQEISEDFNKMALAIQTQEQTGKDFIANVSHEMRTPLTIIIGFLQGIADGTVPEEKQSEYINLVLGETKRLARLVTELLEVARLESSLSEPEFQKFDINTLVKQVIIKFEKGIESKGLNINFSFEDRVCVCFAEKDGIERVLTNLIDNAVKFSQNGGYISISTETKNNKIVVKIENSGEGIDKADIGNIWKRFHKSDKARSADKSGVGLGLYIVKNIINRHAEYITVESEKGKFTRFMFTLKKGA